MKLLDTLHRWTGGLIGLVLALLRLSGTILLYEPPLIGLPGTVDP
ncbi:MAG: PepSY domain-containing protein, partial [Sphingopyxis sp.]|nr:PepSY domain-containing protein [Sphingopyxis sp.]